MKIYNVIIEDHHADVEVVSFVNKERALRLAKEKAERYCHDELITIEETNLIGFEDES